MNELIITCSTCKHFIDKICTIRGEKYFNGKHKYCLEVPSCIYTHPYERYFHPKYPNLKMAYNTHQYRYWEPRIDMNILLEDKDFDIC
jgi:hypothetical protein